jgi:hypothetical protein
VSIAIGRVKDSSRAPRIDVCETDRDLKRKKSIRQYSRLTTNTSASMPPAARTIETRRPARSKRREGADIGTIVAARVPGRQRDKPVWPLIEP